MKKILLIILFVSLAVYAYSSIVGGTIYGGTIYTSVADSLMLMDDGSSHVLMADGASRIKLNL